MVQYEEDIHIIEEESVEQMRLALYIKHAVLEDAKGPDVKAEFEKFKTKRTKLHKKSTLYISISLIAAACITSIFILTYSNRKISEKQKEGTMVYAANLKNQDIAISVGDETIDMNSADAHDEGFRISKGNEITFQPSTDADINDVTTLMIPQGKVAEITLADGTRVWMSADTKLIFPRQFSDKGPREVKLYGEAYFEVTHNEKNPFIVDCGEFKTTVLGTTFNIRCYENERPHVTLISGKVKINSKEQDITLLPNQDAELIDNNHFTVCNADLDVATSWKDGSFYFDGQTLKEIAMEIGRWYNMDVVFVSERHINDKLHFNGNREWNIKEIVEQLNMICDAKINVKANTLRIN